MTIALSIAIIWFGRHFRHGHSVSGVADIEALTVGNIVTHLLLVHNLSTRYVVSLNPVLWTVALEWQLYFVFPFVLLPLWRRFGVTALVIAGSLLGLAFLLLPQAYNLAWTCPWFIGLFAMGMAGAVLSESHLATYRTVFLRMPWLPAAAGLCAALLPHGWFGTERYWVEDILIGLATACLILHCGRALREGTGARRDPLLWLFQSRAAVTLGMFSYSLYLVHVPFGWMFLPITRALHLSGPALFAFSLGIKIPLLCALSYGFYLVCERPFLSTGARKPATTSA
jgi:peptidoglycan/LPS O-acetylase OafA/YrhL